MCGHVHPIWVWKRFWFSILQRYQTLTLTCSDCFNIVVIIFCNFDIFILRSIPCWRRAKPQRQVYNSSKCIKSRFSNDHWYMWLSLSLLCMLYRSLRRNRLLKSQTDFYKEFHWWPNVICLNPWNLWILRSAECRHIWLKWWKLKPNEYWRHHNMDLNNGSISRSNLVSDMGYVCFLCFFQSSIKYGPFKSGIILWNRRYWHLDSYYEWLDRNWGYILAR